MKLDSSLSNEAYETESESDSESSDFEEVETEVKVEQDDLIEGSHEAAIPDLEDGEP